MSKLYVGNLPNVVTDADLQLLFFESGIATSAVLLKKGGYAFVDCYEQSLADRAIDKLNGAVFLGSQIVVEPSVAAAQKRKSATKIEMGGDEPMTNGYITSGGGYKVVLSNIPPHANQGDVENLLGSYNVQNVEKGSNSRDHTQSMIVTFDNSDSAHQAASELNNHEFDGYHIKAEVKGGGPGGEEKRRGRPRGFMVGGGGAPGARQTDFPLRILVQSDMVGAIIGRQGTTIRLITQQSRARVDVHRKDNVGSLEKAITIYGNPDNCTNACNRILEVMRQEATTNNKGEITLKVLAHNNLIGRIIGKGGQTIKRIMQETDTKITVSSINDINSFNLERIITVKGSIENMSKAESMISAKLRQSYENDLQAMADEDEKCELMSDQELA